MRSDRTPPSLGTWSVELLVVAAGVAERARGRLERARVGEAQADVAAGDQPLELVRGALGDEPAVVEHGDPVGELVGLLEVLRGEEDRHAARDELADDLPHRAPAARVQAGRRLVEEDDPRVADERHREVEPAPHAARVGRGRLVGRLDEVEPLEQVARRAAGPPRRPRWCRSAIRIRFSSPVSRLSTAENWPVTPIAARTASGSRARSCAGDAELAAVGADQGREDLDDRGLAGAVRAEQREDRALGDVEVDAVEHEVVAVGLAQAGRRDRGASSLASG